jgi:hypothetical protein
MRFSDSSWTVSLNARERLRHQRTFPLSEDLPEIVVRRIPGKRFVIESTSGGWPVRLGKDGRWSKYEPKGMVRAAHQIATWEAVENALKRGDSVGQADVDSDDEPQLDAEQTDTEAETSVEAEQKQQEAPQAA